MNHGDDLITSLETVEKAKAAMLAYQDFPFFKSAYLELEKARQDVHKWEKLQAKWTRLQYLLETKMLEQALFQSDKKELRERYLLLKSCEAESFFK